MGTNHPSPILSSLQAERRHAAFSTGQSTAPGVRGPFDEDALLMLFDEDNGSVIELSSWKGHESSLIKAFLFPWEEASSYTLKRFHDLSCSP